MKYVFLHGLGQTSASWDAALRELDGTRDVLCPDLAQWLSGETPSYAQLYRSLEAYLDALHEPLALCGLSLGGELALQYAAEHGERVHSLVLIGTQVTMPKTLLKIQNVVFWLFPNSAFRSMGMGKKAVLHLTESMMDLDFRQMLKQIPCPVLVLCGEKDRANQKAARLLEAQLPRAELVILPKAGHEVNVDAPEELGQKLKAFFKSQQG